MSCNQSGTTAVVNKQCSAGVMTNRMEIRTPSPSEPVLSVAPPKIKTTHRQNKMSLQDFHSHIQPKPKLPNIFENQSWNMERLQERLHSSKTKAQAAMDQLIQTTSIMSPVQVEEVTRQYRDPIISIPKSSRNLSSHQQGPTIRETLIAG